MGALFIRTRECQLSLETAPQWPNLKFSAPPTLRFAEGTYRESISYGRGNPTRVPLRPAITMQILPILCNY